MTNEQYVKNFIQKNKNNPLYWTSLKNHFESRVFMLPMIKGVHIRGTIDWDNLIITTYSVSLSSQFYNLNKDTKRLQMIQRQLESFHDIINLNTVIYDENCNEHFHIAFALLPINKFRAAEHCIKLVKLLSIFNPGKSEEYKFNVLMEQFSEEISTILFDTTFEEILKETNKLEDSITPFFDELRDTMQKKVYEIKNIKTDPQFELITFKEILNKTKERN
ncbi:hypothetical protein COA01_34345 [Bacillus cereus]|uniref:hypothetical protein n=1 Tax=Bacillus cereus TaxID=1396 RepID=UPI000BFC4076|nr:hypothetical protein [Bacillus cereus]PGP11903.1 hypothetical protein COA01_34345 [Bacillus cereus]